MNAITLFLYAGLFLAIAVASLVVGIHRGQFDPDGKDGPLVFGLHDMEASMFLAAPICLMFLGAGLWELVRPFMHATGG